MTHQRSTRIADNALGNGIAQCARRALQTLQSHAAHPEKSIPRKRPDLRCEPLESRTVLSGSGLVLSELAAAEQRVLQDFDDDWSDWIELQNTSHESLDLSGYHLSDDPAVPSLWTFPPGVSLEAGGHLVVFASGKDTVLGSGELHTNFRLGRDGETVRLYQPGGATLASQLSFPAQLDDISYGLAPVSREVELVSANNPSAILPDGATHWRVELPFDVTHADALDELWLELSYRGGIVIGLGDVELTRRQTDEGAYREERIPLAAGSGLIDFNAVTDATFAVDLADGTYQVTATLGDLSVARDEMALELEGVEVARLATAAGQFVTRTDEVSVVDGQLSVRLADLGGATARAVINRLSIDGGSLGEPLEFDFGSDTSPLAAGAERVTPETVYSPGRGYGWVAGDIRVPTFPPIPPSPLESDENLLWIEATGSLSDFLAEVRLVASEPGVDTDRAGFFARPTPGRSNDEWRSQVAPLVDVSRGGGTFLTDFLLELSSDVPGGVIHYTLDGSLPGYGSPIYDPLIPVPVTKSMQVRAFAAAPGYLAGPIVTHSFVKLAADLEDFSSPLPIMVLDTFVGGAGGDMDRDGDVDYDDLPVFALAMNDPALYQERYNVPAELEGDINRDGWFDGDDITSLVNILANGRPDGELEKRAFKDGFWGVFEASAGDERASLVGSASLQTLAGFRIRGESSSGFDKRPYRAEARDEFGRDKDVSPLGLPADADWILNAYQQFDQTFLSNPFVYALSGEMGRYAIRTRFFELFVNSEDGVLSRDDYVGVYTLMDVIERGEERVDIEKLSQNYTEEPLLGGGYLLKMDTPNGGEIGFQGGGRRIIFLDPSETEIREPQRAAQKEFIENYFNAAIGSFGDRNPETGYATMIDVGSWIDNHLLQMMTLSSDGLGISMYFSKSREGPLKLEPVWDFDRAMGSSGAARAGGFAGWGGKTSFPWWRTLFRDPDFRQQYVDRFQELRRDVWSDENFDAIIDRLVSEVTLEAATRNFEHWTSQQVHPDGWLGEVDEIRTWLHNRLQWLDSQFIEEPVILPADEAEDEGAVEAIVLELPPGAPASAEIYYTLDGSDPRTTSFELLPQFPDLRRDGHLTADATFAVDVTNGVYEVTVALGDLAEVRDEIVILLEGNPAHEGTLSTLARQFTERTFVVDVTDGRLDITLRDLGGETAELGLVGLQIRPVADFSEWAFDFGPADSPVADGHIQTGGEAYSPSFGYGWTSGTIELFDRAVPDAARQDYAAIRQAPARFVVDVPNGWYRVTPVIGDDVAARPQIRVRMEPDSAREVADFFSVPVATFREQGYLVRITDGRLDVELSAAGVGNQAILNALWISPILQFDFGTATSPIQSGHIPVHTGDLLPSSEGFGWTDSSVRDFDRLVLAEGGGISPSAIRYIGEPISVSPGTLVRARTYSPNQAHFFEGASQSFYWSGIVEHDVPNTLPPLAISEIHFHPLDPSAEELAAQPGVAGSDFEFLEVQNLTGQPLDLGGFTLSGGVQFQFPTVVLGAGDLAVIAGNEGAFSLRYGSGATVLGSFSGNLSNGGERLQILAPDGSTVLDFAYDDAAPWPAEADGSGPSLELLSPHDTPAGNYGSADRWVASGLAHGTPGSPRAEESAGGTAFDDLDDDALRGSVNIDDDLAESVAAEWFGG